jgi:hypothetical protein
MVLGAFTQHSWKVGLNNLGTMLFEKPIFSMGIPKKDRSQTPFEFSS